MSRGRPADLDALAEAISSAWSRETASTYTETDRSRGQCGVTALVVHRHLGGRILRTPTAGGMHFYNELDGERVDLTASQFAMPVDYADLPSTPEQAMADTSPEQVTALLKGVRTYRQNAR